MTYTKKWILISLSSIFLALLLIASINFFMDPFWTFNHEHQFNQYQKSSRERQQKSNALYFREKKYDTLIFGSSRTANMNQHKWSESTFNYSASDMKPNEYNEYLNFALLEAKQPIKKVIIGLDFFGSLTYTPIVAKEPRLILDKITEPFYKYKLLFSLDTLTFSMHNFKYTFKKLDGKYDYNYVKTPKIKSQDTLESFNKKVNSNALGYKRRYSTEYDSNYIKIITKLVNSHPDIKFIVYTSPVSEVHFRIMQNQNLYEEYERWLQESVHVFKEINHYMYINDVTKNANLYFMDSHHGYATTYECITNDLLSKESNCPKINMVLTKRNIETNLDTLRKLNTQ